MRRYLALTILFCSFAIAPVAQAQDAAKKEKSAHVVAEIDGQKITKVQLEKEIARQLRTDISHFNDDQKHKMQKQMLERMIRRELISKAAIASNNRPSKEKVDQVYSQIKSRFKDDEKFKAFLEQGGLDAETFKKELEKDLSVEKYVNEKILNTIEVTDKEAKALYEESPEKFSRPTQVWARHILLKVEPDTAAEKEEEIKKKAEGIANEAKKKGADFSELAKRYSEGPTSVKGGDLGYFTKNQMVKPFADKSFELKPGEISDPVKTRFGYHIIKVEGRKDAGVPKFEEISEQLKAYIGNNRKREALEQHVAELKDKSKVIVYLD